MSKTEDQDDEQAGTGAGSDDPPTLPPFSADGPTPKTIHGVPAADVFGGDGDVDDLFSAPSVPATPPSAPVGVPQRAAVPPLAPLKSSSSAAKPSNVPPPAPGAKKKPPTLAPIGSTSKAKSSAQAPSKPAASKTGGKLPPATSLIEKIRAANKRKTDAAAAAAAASKQADTPDLQKSETPNAKDESPEKASASAASASAPEKASTPAPEKASTPAPEKASVPAPEKASTPAPEKASAPIPEAESLNKAVAEQSEPSDTDPSKAEPSGTRLSEAEPERGIPVAAPSPIAADTPIEHVEANMSKTADASLDSLATQPHPSLVAATPEDELDSLATKPHPSLASVDAPANLDAPANEDRLEALPTRPHPSVGGSTMRGPPIKPLTPASADTEDADREDEFESERTVQISKHSTRVAHLVPPANKSAPPPPKTTATDEDKPKVGVPYEAPALILKPDEAPLETGAETEQPAAAPARPTALPPPRRGPGHGNRRPPADPRVAARLADAAAAQPTTVPNSQGPNSQGPNSQGPNTVRNSQAGSPSEISASDTASLITRMTNEIVADASAESAATLRTKIPPPAVPLPPEEEEPSDERRKYLFFFVAGVAAASLIAFLLTRGKTEPSQPDAPTVAAQELEEPLATGPEPGVPASEVVAGPAAGTETGQAETEGGSEDSETEDSETETGAETGEDEPVVAVAPKNPKPKAQPKPEPKPTPKPEPKPKPVTTPKPAPGPTDNRTADQLYTAAKSAYNSGKPSEAYKLAYASWRKKDKSKVAELMTRAACKMRDTGKASSSLKKVTLIKRGGIKKECRAMGVSL